MLGITEITHQKGIMVSSTFCQLTASGDSSGANGVYLFQFLGDENTWLKAGDMSPSLPSLPCGLALVNFTSLISVSSSL